MKPSLLQKVFARHWVWTTGFYGFAVSFTLAIAVQDHPNQLHIAFLIAMGTAGGAMLSWGLLQVLWFFRVSANGGPFRKGDLLQVIAGPYAGTQGRVYEVWDSRNQVRIQINELTAKSVTDVFSLVQVMRVSQKAGLPEINPAREPA